MRSAVVADEHGDNDGAPRSADAPPPDGLPAPLGLRVPEFEEKRVVAWLDFHENPEFSEHPFFVDPSSTGDPVADALATLSRLDERELGLGSGAAVLWAEDPEVPPRRPGDVVFFWSEEGCTFYEYAPGGYRCIDAPAPGSVGYVLSFETRRPPPPGE